MKISVTRPATSTCTRFLAAQSVLSFSYPKTGSIAGSDEEVFPPGYDHDFNEVIVGRGQATFERVRTAIRAYAHFPRDWAFAFAASGPPRAGQDVAVAFRQLGLWWLNGSRIVRVIDQPDYYGFSYGTLPSHVERGEELFYTRLDADGVVHYGIKAFSRPRFWGARLLKPYARYQQRRFVNDSLSRMQKICG